MNKHLAVLSRPLSHFELRGHMIQTPSPAGRLRGQHHGAVSSSKLSPALGGGLSWAPWSPPLTSAPDLGRQGPSLGAVCSWQEMGSSLPLGLGSEGRYWAAPWARAARGLCTPLSAPGARLV